MPESITAQTRIRVQIFASLCRYYINRGARIETKSGGIALALEDLYNQLISNGLLDPFTTDYEAQRFLAMYGLSGKARSKKDLLGTLYDSPIKISDGGPIDVAEAIRESLLDEKPDLSIPKGLTTSDETLED